MCAGVCVCVYKYVGGLGCFYMSGVCVCERVCLNMSVLGVSCVFVNVHV